MSDTARKGSNWATLGLILVLVLAVYVLSIGPASVVATRGGLGRGTWRILNVVYAPLDWLMKHNSFFRELMHRYILFWHDITGTLTIQP